MIYLKKERSSFSGKIGFVLAAAGSAVGLGNLWRFPYLAAKYGGGIFLLIYLILAVTFGFSLMVAEIAIGRKTGLSCIGAYNKLSSKFSFLGWFAALVPVIIFPYYCVIGGWVTKYLAVYISGMGREAAGDGFFEGFISQTASPLLWLGIFMFATAIVVFFGVEKGIEKFSKVCMPILVVLALAISVYVVTRPGALEGVKYYILPDFSRLSVKTVLAALGQLFYSMSLAMGIMITYGSYMKKEVDLEKSVRQIELFDTGIAFIAGLIIVPAVFVFSGGNEEALNKGPGLMFVTLPKVFNDMELGGVIGAVFFVLVLFAALTSSISLMETVVSFCQDRFHIGRKASCIAVLILSLLLAVPSSLGFGVWSNITFLGGMTFLDLFDFLTNSVMMPIVSLLTCILIGYVVGIRPIEEEVELSSKFRQKKLFEVMIKYIAPICIVAILISSVLDSMGVFKI